MIPPGEVDRLRLLFFLVLLLFLVFLFFLSVLVLFVLLGLGFWVRRLLSDRCPACAAAGSRPATKIASSRCAPRSMSRRTRVAARQWPANRGQRKTQNGAPSLVSAVVAEHASDVARDGGRQVRLDREHVALRPDRRCAPTDVRPSAHRSVAPSPHAALSQDHRAFDDPPDAKLSGDLTQWALRLFVGHRRGPRDDAEARDLGEVGDQGLGIPSAK